MRRWTCVFVGLYAAVMLGLAGFLAFRPLYSDSAKVLGATGAAIVVVALAMCFTRTDESAASRPWTAGILVLGFVQWAVLWARSDSSTREMLLPLVWLIPFAAAAFLFLSWWSGRLQGSSRRSTVWILCGACGTGAVLILLTAFVRTTDGAMGWQILALKAHWITYDYNLAAELSETAFSSFVRAVFAVLGCAAYGMALVAAIAAIGMLAGSRASLLRLRRSRWLPWMAGAACLIGFWVYNDIYWGWQAVLLDVFDHESSNLPGATSLVLEFAGAAAVVLIVIAGWRNKATARAVHTVQVAQLPIAAFNFEMMQALTGDLIRLPGLILLMIGLQLLTWGLLGILLLAESDELSESMTRQPLARSVAVS